MVRSMPDSNLSDDGTRTQFLCLTWRAKLWLAFNALTSITTACVTEIEARAGRKSRIPFPKN